MAYNIPTFNLTCAIYTYVAPPGPLLIPRLTPACNLQYARKVNAGIQEYSYGDPDIAGIMYLLLPLLTDVRPCCVYNVLAQQDLVICPAGSGRIYSVLSVDDVGKGFPNEYRVAQMAQTSDWGAWPAPIP